jgi:hypothetical protein
MMMRPVHTSSQYEEIARRSRKFEITATSKLPNTTPAKSARPPKRLTPPITAAVMALNVYTFPAVGSPDPIIPASAIPAAAANRPETI